MVEYFHRDQLVREADLPADLTLLDYLRDQRGLTGTKEGCASGDCGACTVILARALNNDEVQYQTVNSCLCPATELHGRALITVQELSDQGELHPIQQSFVAHHASQCGFCTPGFLVSAFALLKREKQPDRDQINQALGGNLCRCTGYAPIIAALQDPAAGAEDRFDRQRVDLAARLRTLPQALLTEHDSGYAIPTTLAELAEQIQRWPDYRPIAGGTDLMLEVTQQLAALPRLIAINRIAEFQGIALDAGRVRVGAAVSFSELLQFAQTLEQSQLFRLLQRIGSEQIRNRGTLAGNLANASPIGDMAPVLLTLDAELSLWSPEGERVVPLTQFFTGYRSTMLRPGELIREISFDLPGSDELFVIEKVSRREEDDISALLLAFRARHQGAQIRFAIGLGGMAATPLRATALEVWLASRGSAELALADIQAQIETSLHPIDDLRASAGYRKSVLAQLIWEAVQAGQLSWEAGTDD